MLSTAKKVLVLGGFEKDFKKITCKGFTKVVRGLSNGLY